MTVLCELEGIAEEWFDLGLCLGLKNSTLKAIEENESKVAKCKREMVISWLRMKDNSTPSWQALVSALKKPIVGRRDIACQIKKTHMVSEGLVASCK